MKNQSGSKGANCLWIPVLTISTHLGSSTLPLLFKYLAYALIKSMAATSLTVIPFDVDIL
jgi:hypothetical protein